MPPTIDLAARIAQESASLPREKQSAILDFILFLKDRSAQSDTAKNEGNAAWERIIADPRPRPKLDAYLKSIEHDETEPMDFDRL
ncbi:MAG: hypothetical protein H0V56_00105 [Chthoniobacterales bacterium]|nr:hypothetical protein [Chthoniobacterales bacterium]